MDFLGKIIVSSGVLAFKILSTPLNLIQWTSNIISAFYISIKWMMMNGKPLFVLVAPLIILV